MFFFKKIGLYSLLRGQNQQFLGSVYPGSTTEAKAELKFFLAGNPNQVIELARKIKLNMFAWNYLVGEQLHRRCKTIASEKL